MLKAKLIAAVILGVAAPIGIVALPLGPVMAQEAATLKTQVFTVENMVCPLCPITVRKAIEDVAGVKSVKVDLDTKTATVVYDPSVATLEEIADASTFAGYPAEPQATTQTN